MYDVGDGVPEDRNKAVPLFIRGCRLGEKEGCRKLWAAAMGGVEAAEDRAKMGKHLHKACVKYGFEQACEDACGLGWKKACR